MSNFEGKAVNPKTGKSEKAWFMDDYFGKHRYGVRFLSDFPEGKIYREEELQETTD